MVTPSALKEYQYVKLLKDNKQQSSTCISKIFTYARAAHYALFIINGTNAYHINTFNYEL